MSCPCKYPKLGWVMPCEFKNTARSAGTRWNTARFWGETGRRQGAGEMLWPVRLYHATRSQRLVLSLLVHKYYWHITHAAFLSVVVVTCWFFVLLMHHHFIVGIKVLDLFVCLLFVCLLVSLFCSVEVCCLLFFLVAMVTIYLIHTYICILQYSCMICWK